MKTIYFDYNATTPLDPQVREAMMPFLEGIFGNPSSVHHVGRQARSLLDDARDRAATILGAKPSEIVFTSGGTESNNLAIFGAARLLKPKGRHLITTAIEHDAVLNCFEYLAKVIAPNLAMLQDCLFDSFPPLGVGASSTFLRAFCLRRGGSVRRRHLGFWLSSPRLSL